MPIESKPIEVKPVKIKICGITQEADLRQAIELDVDAIGFNFYCKSPRFIEVNTAKRFIELLPEKIIPVGVFVDEEPQKVREVALESKIKIAQLHFYQNRLTANSIVEYKKHLTGLLQICCTIGLQTKEDVVQIEEIKSLVDFILIDFKDQKRAGGTGREIENNILNQIANSIWGKTFLAGGLTPENIAEKIRRYRPYAVDVASGVEQSPGIKDFAKMKQFVENSRAKS